MSGSRAALTVVVVTALWAAGCGADPQPGAGPEARSDADPVTGLSVLPPPTERPPLGDPPDPGPVPSTDGLGAAERARAVAATGRVSGIACGRLSEGTAFAVDDDLMVTSAHVVVGLDEIVVESGRDGSPTRRAATVVAFDAVADIAALHLPGAALPALAVDVSGTGAGDGTTGAVVGWERSGPQTAPFRIDRPVTVRIDDATRTDRVERPSWLVAVRVDQGDSGGPLVAPGGRVVGVVYAATRRDAGVAYALRSAELGDLLAEAGDRRPVDVPDC